MDENVIAATAPDGAVAVATPLETRQALQRRQARGYTLLRNILVQLPEPDEQGRRASVLARILHEGRHRALILYLLLIGAWPELEGRNEPLQAGVWIRALTGSSRALTWTRSTLSRAWADLEDLGLVERTRVGRLVQVRPCREDGKGVPYEPPGGRKDLWNAYFVLPDVFWAEDGLFDKLKLPGLAMFLLFAKETNKSSEVRFTYEQFEQWYGIKRRTAQNGIRQLSDLGVLNVRREVIPAPLSPTGSTARTWYSLTADFGHLARQAMRERAATERAARASMSASATTPTTAASKPQQIGTPQ